MRISNSTPRSRVDDNRSSATTAPGYGFASLERGTVVDDNEQQPLAAARRNFLYDSTRSVSQNTTGSIASRREGPSNKTEYGDTVPEVAARTVVLGGYYDDTISQTRQSPSVILETTTSLQTRHTPSTVSSEDNSMARLPSRGLLPYTSEEEQLSSVDIEGQQEGPYHAEKQQYDLAVAQNEQQHNFSDAQRKISENTNPKHSQSVYERVERNEKSVVSNEENTAGNELNEKESITSTVMLLKNAPLMTGHERVETEPKKKMWREKKVSTLSNDMFPQHVPSITNCAEMDHNIDKTGEPWQVGGGMKSTCKAPPSLKPPSRLNHQRIERQVAEAGTGVAAMPSIVPPERPSSWSRPKEHTPTDQRTNCIGARRAKKMPYFKQDERKRLPPPQDQQYTTFPGMATMSAVAGPPTQDEEKKHVKRFEGEPRASSPPPLDQQYTMFPALAEPSVATPGTPPQDKKKKHSKIDGQPDIIQQHDETMSQMRDTEVVTPSMPRGNQDGDGGNGSQQSSSPSTRPSGLVPVEFPARVGAYAIDGFGTGRNTGWESDVESAEQRTFPEPAASLSEGRDHTFVANAVTTDDLENRMRSRIISEAVTVEAVTEVVTPKEHQPFYKTKWFLVLVGFLSLSVIGGIVGGIIASRSDSGSPLTASPTRAPSTNIPTFDTARPTMGPTVVASQGGNGGSPSASIPPVDMSWPTMTPTVDPVIVSTIALVEENSFDGGDALKNSSSPQYKALDWMIRNGNLVGEYDEDRILQRFALAALYFSTNGTGWDSNTFWLTDEHECDWRSDSDPCSDGKFISTLKLWSNNLVGTLPPELAFLSSSLEIISLGRNSLSGPIPTTFGSLTSLVSIGLSFNSLSGPIPGTFGSLTNLVNMSLSSNSLSGPIPTTFGSFTSLEELFLSNNDLSSSIPSQIGLITRLKDLSLSYNNLNGTIPTKMIEQLLNRLEGLYLSGNKLTGTIPSEIGRARSLEGLSLSGNKLTGTIPSEINGLTNLEWLWLHNNKLTGTIPSEINGLTSLDDLSLFNNNFAPPFACPEFIAQCYVSCYDYPETFDSNCRQL